MEIYQIEKPTLFNVCQRCGHTWPAKDKLPTHCPNKKCNSPYWMRPRKIVAQMRGQKEGGTLPLKNIDTQV